MILLFWKYFEFEVFALFSNSLNMKYLVNQKNRRRLLFETGRMKWGWEKVREAMKDRAFHSYNLGILCCFCSEGGV